MSSFAIVAAPAVCTLPCPVDCPIVELLAWFAATLVEAGTTTLPCPVDCPIVELLATLVEAGTTTLPTLPSCVLGGSCSVLLPMTMTEPPASCETTVPDTVMPGAPETSVCEPRTGFPVAVDSGAAPSALDAGGPLGTRVGAPTSEPDGGARGCVTPLMMVTEPPMGSTGCPLVGWA